MELTLTTPALLFPTVSLLMVAYTNRFLTVASRIRALHATHRDNQDDNIAGQIKSLRLRVQLIKNMQAFGVACLLSCVICMFVLFAGFPFAGKMIFAASLTFSFREVLLSVEALNIALSDMENFKGKKQ